MQCTFHRCIACVGGRLRTHRTTRAQTKPCCLAQTGLAIPAQQHGMAWSNRSRWVNGDMDAAALFDGGVGGASSQQHRTQSDARSEGARVSRRRAPSRKPANDDDDGCVEEAVAGAVTVTLAAKNKIDKKWRRAAAVASHLHPPPPPPPPEFDRSTQSKHPTHVSNRRFDRMKSAAPRRAARPN